jgi:hypothetical protein
MRKVQIWPINDSCGWRNWKRAVMESRVRKLLQARFIFIKVNNI